MAEIQLALPPDLDQEQLEKLRKEIAIGVEQADRGELIDGPLFFKELRGKLEIDRS